ncbi:8-oxo-dGTP diphosphatase MutT [Methylophaga sp. OBS4]|jgi:8-oxo-dGTP diphosphatase|uniref:8-oxo-dGTP diphosphatase MutT n=1 Tax=Methylophaga sp. OBS4 TaxID=2991935 RepID=UPI002253A065|nr:8-oxo-dGTP diphosphatase MutT [Methylophaga sp. OBS4]MCX4188411.1 8-oxo-dGTP diphosphatase MutT [Methylophaga sp. OBS4]
MRHIEVAVAVMLNPEQQVLTSWRQPHQHQGGLWEFPGGKREAEESRLDALKREVDEELGVKVEQAEPFILIEHDYGDKRVSLDVWIVSQFSGEPQGREGQPLRWQAIKELEPSEFPAANIAIIEALKQR